MVSSPLLKVRKWPDNWSQSPSTKPCSVVSLAGCLWSPNGTMARLPDITTRVTLCPLPSVQHVMLLLLSAKAALFGTRHTLQRPCVHSFGERSSCSGQDIKPGDQVTLCHSGPVARL